MKVIGLTGGIATSCPHLAIAINSNMQYSTQLKLLLESLERVGVPMAQVHVFTGGAGDGGETLAVAAAAATDSRGVTHHPVPINSMDLTGLIHISEHPAHFGKTQAPGWRPEQRLRVRGRGPSSVFCLFRLRGRPARP